MVEWGQVPSSLEIITSEDLNPDMDTFLERNEVRVLPAVGCGVDNLDVLKSRLVVKPSPNNGAFATPRMGTFCDGRVVSLSSPSSIVGDGKYIRLEAVFTESPQTDSPSDSVKGDIQRESIDHPQRIRVSFDARLGVPSLSGNFRSGIFASSIEFYRERRTAVESSHGKIADGGGLDGRTVSSLVGRDTVFHADPRGPLNIQTSMARKVLRVPGDEGGVSKTLGSSLKPAYLRKYEVENFFQNDKSEESIISLSLPRNVVIRYNKKSENRDDRGVESPWWIQIGLLTVDEGVSEKEDKKISPGRATITGATVITWELSEDGEMLTFCDVIT